MPSAERRRRAAERAGSTKGAAKGGAKKPAAGNGADGDGFTSGAENPNRTPDPAGVKPASRKGQTGELFSDRKIPELHAAALAYVETRDARMALTAQETAEKDALISLMKKHKKEEYNCDGLKITFEHVEEDKLKVKLQKPDADGDGDG